VEGGEKKSTGWEGGGVWEEEEKEGREIGVEGPLSWILDMLLCKIINSELEKIVKDHHPLTLPV